jgi:hypothetical protein
MKMTASPYNQNKLLHASFNAVGMKSPQLITLWPRLRIQLIKARLKVSSELNP